LPILALAAAAMASAQNSPKPVKTPPMIVHNPDGTFTVQKEPPKDGAKGTAQKGLVIPPQVVVPIIPARERTEIARLSLAPV
jgi:hypothetical protein